MPENLDTLPPEVQAQIIRHFVDPSGLARTLNNMKNLRLVNWSLHNGVEVALRAGAIQQVNATLLKNNATLDETPIEKSGVNRRSLNLQHLTVEADFIPVKSVNGRSTIVRDLLAYKFHAPEDAVSNLISNIDYLKPEERSLIADHVCSFQRGLGEAESLVTQLVKKAEYLAPEDRSALVSVSCELPAETLRKSLEFWGDKMHLLGEGDQSKVLSHIYQDSNEKGRSLAYFAEYADRLTPLNRSNLTDHVVALAADHQGKWQAFSHLAEHLPSLSQMDREQVASHIVANYATSVEETAEPDADQTWYSRADFCKTEALHHLSAHQTLFKPLEQNRVDAFIREKIERSDAGRFIDQAQLITHLSEEQRRGFVRAALRQGDEQQSGVTYALTARMKDLDGSERQIYISRVVEARPIYDDLSKEAVDYNICNNLEHFTSAQRTTLIRRQLDIITEHEDPSYAGPAFADIANNAKFLRIKDIDSIVAAANHVVGEYIGDLDEMNDEVGASIRSCSGHAIRSLTSWAGEAISNPRAAQWVSSIEEMGAIDHQMTDDTDDPSDGENRRASNRTSEHDSQEGSSYGDGSDTDSSDDDGGGNDIDRGRQRLSRSHSVSSFVRKESHAITEDDGRNSAIRQAKRSVNRLGRSASEAISISSDEEPVSNPQAGPSTPAHRAGKRNRNATDPIEEPKSKRPRRDDRERSRSSSIEL